MLDSAAPVRRINGKKILPDPANRISHTDPIDTRQQIPLLILLGMRNLPGGYSLYDRLILSNSPIPSKHATRLHISTHLLPEYPLTPLLFIHDAQSIRTKTNF